MVTSAGAKRAARPNVACMACELARRLPSWWVGTESELPFANGKELDLGGQLKRLALGVSELGGGMVPLAGGVEIGGGTDPLLFLLFSIDISVH